MTIEELISKLIPYGQVLTFIGQIIIALVAVTIAIFGDNMKTWYRHPNLEIMKKIDCYEQKDKIGDIITSVYHYRFRIKNSGNLYAEKAEVFAKELLNVSQEKIESFIPRRFKWTNTGQPIYDIISPGMEKHCDLLHFIDPGQNKEKKLDLDLEVLAIEEFIIRPDTYYLVIQLTSANSKRPVEKILQINNTGTMGYGEIKIDILKKFPNLSGMASMPIKLTLKEILIRKIMKIWAKIK